jgi:hypothetical protein
MAARKTAADPTSVKIPTAIDLHKELNTLKPTEFPWMYASSKCAPQEALRDLDTAFANFFAKRAQYPRFKQRRKGIGSFTLTGTIHVGPDWIQLPVLGKLRLFEHGYLLQDTDLATTDRKTLKKRKRMRCIKRPRRSRRKPSRHHSDRKRSSSKISTLRGCSKTTSWPKRSRMWGWGNFVAR